MGNDGVAENLHQPRRQGAAVIGGGGRPAPCAQPRAQRFVLRQNASASASAATSPGGTRKRAAWPVRTVRYPALAAATTGLPALIASVSTMPKLSP
jgi:hypothetical protein